MINKNERNNFSEEIVLRFNLGPLHLLEGLVAEVFRILKAKKKEFVYKRDKKGKLRSKDHGSSMMSFRKREEAKSKFPLGFWQQ